MPFFLLFILILYVAVFLCISMRVVPKGRVLIIERLGRYHASWQPGIHFLAPFIDRIRGKINLEEQSASFPPQTFRTEDNASLQIDAAVFFLISDPKRYTYSVDDPNSAIEKLTTAALREIIASMDRDTALHSRDEIQSQLFSLLENGADVLGIRISRVELKDISRAPDSFTW